MATPITSARIAAAPASVYYIPDYITPQEEQILVDKQSGVFDGLDTTHRSPNHCLVNEYLAGQGIMPHKDGPAYLPTVATVSLSSHCVLEFYKAPEAKEGDDQDQDKAEEGKREPEFSMLVQPRSLLVLKEDVYNKYMHGIREITSDDLRQGNILNLDQALPEGLQDDDKGVLERNTRISLTFRIVQKTLSTQRILLRR
ncbi:Alpha-ketoglutarate-dependent dioxygenase alkB 6 [Mortierella sp. GBA43]|nr:Alpha-ketoglutarate-dependent dioxygenase alkB 6 [Mortierella sp. GBA43]